MANQDSIAQASIIKTQIEKRKDRLLHQIQEKWDQASMQLRELKQEIRREVALYLMELQQNESLGPAQTNRITLRNHTNTLKLTIELPEEIPSNEPLRNHICNILKRHQAQPREAQAITETKTINLKELLANLAQHITDPKNSQTLSELQKLITDALAGSYIRFYHRNETTQGWENQPLNINKA